MYTENDLKVIGAQLKKRWTLLLVPVLALLAVVVVGVTQRNEIMTTVATILAGVLLIAGYDLAIKPLRCYQHHLNNVLHGITHELTAPYLATSEDVSEVDGVLYYTLTVSCLDEKNKPYDRMFYYDKERPRPTFAAGQMVHLVYHDHELASIEAV